MPLFKLQNQKRPSTASSVPTLKPLLFQYSLYRFIVESCAEQVRVEFAAGRARFVLGAGVG